LDENIPTRIYTVVCQNSIGVCYFIKREDFEQTIAWSLNPDVINHLMKESENFFKRRIDTNVKIGISRLEFLKYLRS